MLLQPAARYPADPRALFMLVLSVFTGGTALLLEVAPKTINAVLPHWGVMIWGVLLLLGSVITLCGMAVQDVNGIICEQIGSVMVGVTTIFYSVVALSETGLAALQPVGLVLAWGLSCLLRWVQLQLLLHRAYRSQIIAETERGEHG